MGPGTLGRMPNDAPRELRVVLTVANFDEAAAFYREAVGLRQVADCRVSGRVRLALEVPDSEETARRLVEAGAEEVAPPVMTPWGDRNARVKTPDGIQLTLFPSAGD